MGVKPVQYVVIGVKSVQYVVMGVKSVQGSNQYSM